MMARYSVHVFCNECSGIHPMGIQIDLDDGPADQASIGDVYAGRDLPPKVASLLNNAVHCPDTGNFTAQRDNNQVYLVPIG